MEWPVFPKIYPLCDAVRAQLLRLRVGREASKISVYTAGRFVGISEVFSGPALSIVYNTPGLTPNEDARTPAIIVTPYIDVDLFEQRGGLAVHGGLSHDDTNVTMLVSNPGLLTTTTSSPVETAQVAPTILRALGLDPQSLQAVREEGTQVLSGLSRYL